MADTESSKAFLGSLQSWQDAKAKTSQVVLCRPCEDRGQHQLRELPDLYFELSTAIAAGGQPMADEKPRGSKMPPIPIRADVLDLMADLTEFLESWEDAHRKHAGYSRRDQYGQQQYRMAQAHKYVTAHYESIIEMDPNFVVEVGMWRWRSRKALQRTKLIHRLPAPCPADGCDQVALFREDGSDRVQCEACGASWDETEYKRLVYVLAYEIRQKQKAAS